MKMRLFVAAFAFSALATTASGVTTSSSTSTVTTSVNNSSFTQFGNTSFSMSNGNMNLSQTVSNNSICQFFSFKTAFMQIVQIIQGNTMTQGFVSPSASVTDPCL